MYRNYNLDMTWYLGKRNLDFFNRVFYIVLLVCGVVKKSRIGFFMGFIKLRIELNFLGIKYFRRL